MLRSSRARHSGPARRAHLPAGHAVLRRLPTQYCSQRPGSGQPGGHSFGKEGTAPSRNVRGHPAADGHMAVPTHFGGAGLAAAKTRSICATRKMCAPARRLPRLRGLRRQAHGRVLKNATHDERVARHPQAERIAQRKEERQETAKQLEAERERQREDDARQKRMRSGAPRMRKRGSRRAT